MLGLIALGGLVGVLLGNAIPHFVKGITRENYPCLLGNGPVGNLVGGWICLVLAGALAKYLGAALTSTAALSAAALGMLAIGLFHAAIGARGLS